jgi:ribulose-bisphosphate carboxylase large chain
VDLVRVSYRIEGLPDVPAAEARAEAIAREQTVEVPRAVIDREPAIAERVVGRVESVEVDGEGAHRLTIAYPVAATAHDPAQLLNVAFGMTSLQPDAACVDIVLPQSLRTALRGPRFGIEGLRKLTGVEGRALTCTAVKPMGHDPKALAGLMSTFAQAGIDVVKDDQGLADHAFCPFEERVRACLDAAREVAERTGHHTLYAPNLIGTPARVVEQLHVAEELGARAVMVSPMLIGLPFFWELCHQRASVPVIAHPSFGGAQRFATDLLFGGLLRWYGADAVIFVGYGGRYATPRDVCRRLAARLRGPEGGMHPSLPVPGGGVELANVPELLSFYGRDVMLLVGGSLQLEAGAVAERSRAFVDAVRARPFAD